jgi:hypothetical protein
MASGDLRRALDGDTSPGADSQLLASWSKDFWQVVHGQERSAERQQRLAPLIEQLGKEYPEIKTLSEPVFLPWWLRPWLSRKNRVLRSKETRLDVLVRERDLPAVAANLYSFVRVNDVFAARCGCDARTNVGIAELGFPAYLFRLDSEERTSKILISIGNPDFGLTLPVPSVRRVTGAA